MARVCTVCRHPEVDEINQAIVNGEPQQGLADEFELSLSAINRHARQHVPVAMVPGTGTPIPLRGIIWRLADIMERARVVEDEAHEKGHLSLTLKAQVIQVRIADKVMNLAIMVEEREHFLEQRERKKQRYLGRAKRLKHALPAGYKPPETVEEALSGLSLVQDIVGRGRGKEDLSPSERGDGLKEVEMVEALLLAAES